MLDTIFATKMGMTQAWLKNGKRLAITKCRVEDNIILTKQPNNIFEIGYLQKKLKRTTKPLREKIKKSGFSFGVRQIRGVTCEDELTIGGTVTIDQVLELGDVVQVQGKSKGRGFAGGMKRYGFHGGPKTHGQSDRARAVGSIGSGTDPGRVWKGKRMPGHYGDKNITVNDLVVVYLDKENREVWLSGTVPGFNTSIVRIKKTSEKKNLDLDLKLIGLEKAENKDKSADKGDEVIEEPKAETITQNESVVEEKEQKITPEESAKDKETKS